MYSVDDRENVARTSESTTAHGIRVNNSNRYSLVVNCYCYISDLINY